MHRDINGIRPCLSQLFYGFLVSENVAVNTTQERIINFKDGKKQMISRLTDRRI
jgi:hypothetical protein